MGAGKEGSLAKWLKEHDTVVVMTLPPTLLAPVTAFGTRMRRKALLEGVYF